MDAMSPQTRKLVEQIELQLITAGSLARAVEMQRDLFRTLGMLTAANEATLEEAHAEVARRLSRPEVSRARSSHARSESWFSGSPENAVHWPALRAFLREVESRDEDTLSALDAAANEIVGLLGNPRLTEFDCRGMVVGHVQSGKTANMTAVIAKAVDAGYDMVVVLTGLTNKLRRQTQQRLVRDLVERRPNSWSEHTTVEPDGDFVGFHGGRIDPSDPRVQLIVMKKTARRGSRKRPNAFGGPLGKLKRGFESMTAARIARLKVLVIDDECDQASVNSSTDENDVTATNECLRRILSILPCSSYVGYTATPFANVLINPCPSDRTGIDDLYPKDFITALETSPAYFGTARLFGRPPADPAAPAPEESGLDVIRLVSDDDQAMLQPERGEPIESFSPEMPPSLEDAILWFLACCAARHERGQADRHMTMLVHTSALVAVHRGVQDLIGRWVHGRRAALHDPGSAATRRLLDLWEAESGRVPDDLCPLEAVPGEALVRHLPAVLERLEFPIENGESDARLDYGDVPRCYIVVGGAILARGLTLDGLMASYFLRSASQYDTLLQMGRWFGYRSGYEDLPRIWMVGDLADAFEELAGVEDAVRADIASCIDQGQTPLDVAVRIPLVPGLSITGPGKMRHAVVSDSDFHGRHDQTTRFRHRDPSWLGANWEAGDRLLRALQADRAIEAPDAPLLWRDVPASLVADFLGRYSVHPGQAALAGDQLTDFVRRNAEEHPAWNVAVHEPVRARRMSARPLGPRSVRTVNRARVESVPGDDSAYIKALMSRRDILADAGELREALPSNAGWAQVKEARSASTGHVPLLLLYAVDAESVPQGPGRIRVPLEAVADMLGFGVVFPGRRRRGRAGTHVSVDLGAVRVDGPEGDEGDDDR